MVAYFLVFLIVWWVRSRTVVRGYNFSTYLAGYGAARFIIEFFRGDPAIFAWGIPAAQVFSVGMLLTAGLLFIRLDRPGAMMFVPSRGKSEKG